MTPLNGCHQQRSLVMHIKQSTYISFPPFHGHINTVLQADLANKF